MEKKYQLVAWTRNVADKENARLTMIPSRSYEMQEPYFEDIGMHAGAEEAKGTHQHLSC